MSDSTQKLKAFHEAVEKLRIEHGISCVKIESDIFERDALIEKSIIVGLASTLGRDSVLERYRLLVEEMAAQRRRQADKFP